MDDSNLVYYLLIGLVVVLGLWLGRDEKRGPRRLIYVMAVAAAMVVIATLRYGIGFDYHSYIDIANEIAASPWSAITSGRTEPGFWALTKLITGVSQSPVFMYAVYAAVMYGVLALSVYRYSALPWLSFAVFIGLQFFSQSMNLIRQNIAIILILPAIMFLRDKKPIPYFVLVLLACSLHKSSLIMIPVYFLVKIPLNRYSISLYSAGTLFAFAFSERIMNFVLKHVYSSYQPGTIYYAGSSFRYVVIPIILLAAVLSLSPRLLRADPRNLVFLNLAIYGAFFNIMFVRHFILERFSMYFTVSLVVVLPLLIKTFEPTAAVPDGKFRSERERERHERQHLREGQQIQTAILATVCFILMLQFAIAASFSFNNVYPYYSIFSQQAKNGQRIPIHYQQKGQPEGVVIPDGVLPQDGEAQDGVIPDGVPPQEP